MNSRSHLLYLEDNLADVELLRDALQAGDLACDITRVDTEYGFLAALQQDGFDLILADYTLPSFDGLSALKMARLQKPDLPFIFVSGTMGEEAAIEALKTGATDYVLKTRLSRLAPAVRRALREAWERRQLCNAERELREREAEIRHLVEASIVGIFIWNPEGQILEANDAFLRLTGYSREELLSGEMCGTDLTPPEWRDRKERLWIPKLKMTGSLQPFEQEYVRKDGSRVPVLIGAASFDESVNRGVAFVLDLTERKRAEEAARQSERELRDVIETIPAVVWGTLADGSNAFVNSRWMEFTGLSAEQTAGSGWQVAIHPDDIQRHIDRWRMCVATGESLEIEVRMRRADGQYRWHLCRGVPLRDELRSIVKWYGVLTDIEDHKRAEEALRSSELRFRLIVDNIPGLVCTMSATGEVELLSRQILEYFGKSLEEMKRWATSDAVHPDDLARVISAWASSIETGHPYDIEHRCLRSDGMYRWFQVRALPVRDAENRITGWYCLLTDIDDRKRAEEVLQQTQFYLREAQKLTHTGSWVFNPADRAWAHVSEEWCHIFGLDPADGAPTWEKRFDHIHPDDSLAWKNAIEGAIAGKTDFDVTFRIILPSGIVKWIRTVGHPVLSATGDLVQFLGSSTDITDHKRAEHEHEKLHQLEAELAHVNRVSMMGEMAASLAHEIKQPIAAAINSANSCITWLGHEPPNLEKARAAATKVDEYGNRAAEIIDRIRSFYRKSLPQRELVEVNRIIQEIITLLDGEATRSSVVMRTELGAGQPVVLADRVQLQQVFMNLMLNAIEAMNDTGGELTVRSRRAQDGQLLFSVSDTGPGLPSGNLDQIFSAFFTTKAKGSGMGLAISRSVVESHGGRLWATANDGSGATFHFSLPTQLME